MICFCGDWVMEQGRRDRTKPDSILASSNEVLQYIEEGKYPPQSDRTMPFMVDISDPIYYGEDGYS